MSISILKLHEYAEAANNMIGGALNARRFDKVHPVDAATMLLALKRNIDNALQANASLKCDGVEYMMDMLKKDVVTKSHMFVKYAAEMVTVKSVHDKFDFPGDCLNIRDLDAMLTRFMTDHLKLVYTILCKKHYIFSDHMIKFATVRRSDETHASVEWRSPLSDVICTFDITYDGGWLSTKNIAQIATMYEEYLLNHNATTYSYQDKFTEV